MNAQMWCQNKSAKLWYDQVEDWNLLSGLPSYRFKSRVDDQVKDLCCKYMRSQICFRCMVNGLVVLNVCKSEVIPNSCSTKEGPCYKDCYSLFMPKNNKVV